MSSQGSPRSYLLIISLFHISKSFRVIKLTSCIIFLLKRAIIIPLFIINIKNLAMLKYSTAKHNITNQKIHTLLKLHPFLQADWYSHQILPENKTWFTIILLISLFEHILKLFLKIQIFVQKLENIWYTL